MANIAAALRSRNPSGGLEKKFLEVPKADDGHLSCSSMQDAGDRYNITTTSCNPFEILSSLRCTCLSR